MAIIQRFSTIRRGGIIFTGNTAGLAPVNASGGRYGTRHEVGRIFGKCDTCAHLQSFLAVLRHQPCRLDARGGVRGLLAAASQSDSVVRSVGGFAGRGQHGHLCRGVSHAGFAAYQRKTFRVGAGWRRGNRRRQPLFGANAGALQTLSGPNNPADNFFASQINNSSGLPDTSGTFGTRNANAAALAATGAEPVAECVTCPNGGVIITQSSVFNGSIRT